VRAEREEQGALRAQPHDSCPCAPAPGTFYERVCICPSCGSKTTIIRGTYFGMRYMRCRRCDHKFKAKSG
jgi:rubredoxin